MNTLLSKATNYLFIKLVGLAGIFTYEFFFGNIPVQALWGIAVLVVMDALTAIDAARKTGVPIESKRFLKSAEKLAKYAVGIIACHITQTVIGVDIGITGLIMGYIGIGECLSILENTSKAGFSFSKKLLERINSYKTTL